MNTATLYSKSPTIKYYKYKGKANISQSIRRALVTQGYELDSGSRVITFKGMVLNDIGSALGQYLFLHNSTLLQTEHIFIGLLSNGGREFFVAGHQVRHCWIDTKTNFFAFRKPTLNPNFFCVIPVEQVQYPISVIQSFSRRSVLYWNPFDK